MELLRFIIGVAFIFMGLLVFFIQLIGVYKFKYILNRMHAAGMGDTMGISLCLIGAMFLFGWGYTSLKIAMIIAFLWLASPVSSHLISRLEVTTNEHLEEYCKFQSPKGDLEEMRAALAHQTESSSSDKRSTPVKEKVSSSNKESVSSVQMSTSSFKMGDLSAGKTEKKEKKS